MNTYPHLLRSFFLSSMIFFFVQWGRAQSQYTSLNISVDLSSSRSTTSSAPSVRQITSSVKPLFPHLNLTGTDIELSGRKESPAAWHYTYIQTYKDIPIYQSMLKVNVSKEGVIKSCMNHLFDHISPSSTSFPEPMEHLVHNVLHTYSLPSVTLSKVYFKQDNELIPALKFNHPGDENSPPWIGIIDANHGKLLSKEIDAAFYTSCSNPSFHFRPTPSFTFSKPTLDTDTSGRALVFVPNPTTRAEVSYGDLFTDNEDQHSPVFDLLMDTVILSPITYDSGIFYLTNEYIILEDIYFFPDTIATSTTGDFFFTRDQSGFEDVMAFYHINQFLTYVQELGFDSLPPRPVYVDPHGLSDRDESAFSTNTGKPTIRFGDGGVDDAEDADVIVHEYCHALSNSASPETFVGLERRGLDEGVADYFAARYSEDISSYEWTTLFDWDGHNEFWDGRVANSPEQYPPAVRAEKAYGTLWASTLVNIRKEIGKEVTDRIMLQELYSNTIGMSLADGAALLIEADSLLYGGVHTETISFWFCARGILTGPSCLSVSTDPGVTSEESWNIFPNPADDKISIARSDLSRYQKLHIEVIDMMGKTILSEPWEDQGATIELLLPMASGMYWLNIYEGEDMVFGHKLLKR